MKSLSRLVLLASLALCLLAPRARGGTYTLKVTLEPVSNDYMSASDYALEKLYITDNGRWRALPAVTNWLVSGTATNVPDFSAQIIYKNRIVDYYVPELTLTTMPGHVSFTNLYSPYSNSLTLAVTGAGVDMSWQMSAYPTEFTNASSSKTAETNTHTLTFIPTGTYSFTFPTHRGYASPPATNVSVSAARLVYSTNTYLPYSNSLSVSVIGYPAGNCAWSVTGPADFTNATGYATSYTNTATISAVPTGTYTFAFPGSIGYTTPTNTLEITGASPAANVVTGIYVLGYPTNIPIGTGIRKFYQPSYFFTNAYLHDSGVPLHTRITDNVGATGVAATISVAWTSNGLAGTDVVITNVGTESAAEFGFVIPIGDTGATGTAGAAASIAVAWTSNGVAGSDAVITNVGTTSAAEFGFIIPAASEAAFTASVAYAISAGDTTLWHQASADGIGATADVAVIQASTSLWNTASDNGISATGDIAVIQSSTSLWNTAATDASAATGDIAVIQSSTSLWNTASDNGISATTDIAIIQSSTGLWNTAATDASTATQYLGTNTIQAQIDALGTQKLDKTEAVTTYATTSTVGGISADVDVLKGQTNLYLTNEPALIAFSNANQAKITAAITNESHLGTIVGLTVVTGEVAGVTTNAEGVLDLTVPSGGTGSGTITNMLSSDSSIAWTNPEGPQPDGSVTAYVAGVVVDYVPTNDATYLAIETNTVTIAASTNVVFFEEGGTNFIAAIASSFDDTALNAATGVLNTAVGNLQAATGSLDTAVGNLNNATGSLDSAVSDLQGATNANLTLIELNQASTNALNTRADNLETATNAINATVAILNTNTVRLTDAAYTNTVALAAAALPKAGGTMTGGLTNIYGYGMGTNLITMFGGVLGGTNGVYWNIGTNNYWILFTP